MAQAHASIMAPAVLDSRLVVEDVPMGLVPIAELGRAAGVPTPIMDAVITLCGALVKRDFRKEGRTLSPSALPGWTGTACWPSCKGGWAAPSARQEPKQKALFSFALNRAFAVPQDAACREKLTAQLERPALIRGSFAGAVGIRALP